MTFRVEFFCDDRRLADALRALAGVARGAPRVEPVVNDIKYKHEGELAAKTDGKLANLFAAHLKADKPGEFRARYAKDFLRALGRPVSGYSYMLRQMRTAGVIKKKPGGKGTSTVYL